MVITGASLLNSEISINIAGKGIFLFGPETLGANFVKPDSGSEDPL